MKRMGLPSVADVTFMMAAPIFAIVGAVRLTQSDGDLAGHIRMGEFIVNYGRIPQHSLASYTAGTDALISPAWLSEVMFAVFYRLGGLPLISVVTGIVIGLTHALIAQFLRRRGVDPRLALATALVTLVLGASHWLARPHMFSILGAALTVFLLESRRRQRNLYFVPLFAIWANLHGGWLFGLLLIAAYATGDFGESLLARETRAARIVATKRNLVALTAAALGTFMNPYGMALHREVFGAVTSISLAGSINEYMSPNFHEIGNFPFLVSIAGVVALLGVVPRRMPLRWLMTILMSLVFALRAGRNIALFGVAAVPLVVLHISHSWPTYRRQFPWFGAVARLDRNARAGPWSISVAVALLALGLSHGRIASLAVIADRFDSRRFPVEAVRRARLAGLHGRIFHPWIWGGYFLEAWPGSSIHVDPLKFSNTTIASHTKIENMDPGWQAELTRWNVELAVLEPGSRLADGLAHDSAWSRWYQDSTSVIFRHGPYAPEGSLNR